MSWEVTPAERLRSITRRGVVDHLLAAEAADALVGFAGEPASLVVACRRLLAHHPGHGALWWVCARILAGAEPRRAARDACALLDADRTADRLAASLPLFGVDERVAAVGWPHAVDKAIAERGDVPIVALRLGAIDPVPDVRRRRTDRPVRIVDAWECETITLLLVPASAIGPDRALVPSGTNELLDEFGSRVRTVWVVGGVGRVLPARLFDAAVAAATDPRVSGVEPDCVGLEVLAFDRIDRVAGPRGVETPADAGARGDCPVVPELLRPLH